MSHHELGPTESPLRFSGTSVFAFGLVVFFFASLALFGASAVRSWTNARVPVTSVTALLLLCAKPAIDRLACSLGAPRAPVVSALGMLSAAPFIGLGALAALYQPIVPSHREFAPSGPDLVDFAMIGTVYLFPVVLCASFAALAFRRVRARVNALLGGARGCALGLAGILLVVSLIRAARKPDPDCYVASLPQIGVVPPVSGAPIATVSPKDSQSVQGETTIYEYRVRDLVVRRECSRERCEVTLRSAYQPAPPGTLPPKGPGLWRRSVSDRAPLSVRRDEKHDLWVVGEQVAFLGPDFLLVDLDVHLVGRDLSPPLGWILGAAVGLLIAGVSTVRRRRVAERTLAVKRGALGTHDAIGWITTHDHGSRFLAPPELALPVGPVVILTSADAQLSSGAPYRDRGLTPGTEVLAGTLEANLAPLRGKMAELDAFALTTVLLTLAPLVAALVRGLVF